AVLLLMGFSGGILAVVTFVLVGRPMRRLSEMARRYGAGDLSGRMELRQRDEIGELAHVMSQMGEELALAQGRLDQEVEGHLSALEQLRHADRLATVGKLASSIAHELGTPLSTISTRALMIASDGLPPAETRESARIISEQANRMTEILHQTL